MIIAIVLLGAGFAVLMRILTKPHRPDIPCTNCGGKGCLLCGYTGEQLGQ